MPAKLPEKELFSPSLNIRVVDSQFGGLRNIQLGNASISLENKMPWSQTYAPPVEVIHISSLSFCFNQYDYTNVLSLTVLFCLFVFHYQIVYR